MIPLSDTTHPIPDAQPTPPCGRGSTNGNGPVGRVVLMGQILVDLAVRGEALPSPGGDVWAIDEGMHVGGGFNALVAARRMGAEAVSLSPIGEGPYSSLIQAALAREGITDLGPRIASIDNGFCIAFTDRTGERTFISTKGAETMAPTSAWADFVRAFATGTASLMKLPARCSACWIVPFSCARERRAHTLYTPPGQRRMPAMRMRPTSRRLRSRRSTRTARATHTPAPSQPPSPWVFP